MKKIVEIEATFCDNCGADTYPHACRKCGAEYCYQCAAKPEIGTVYKHGVYVCGSGDGFYCRPCDIELSESKSDPLHEAYVAVRTLRDEVTAFGEDFEARKKIAEQHLDRLERATR